MASLLGQPQRSTCAFCGVDGCHLRCSACKCVYYCSVEHQRLHWTASHKQSCARGKEKEKTVAAVASLSSAVVAAWPPARVVERVAVSQMNAGAFQRGFNDPCVPVILTGLLDAKFLAEFASSASFAKLLGQCPLQCRMYGKGHLKNSGASLISIFGVVCHFSHVTLKDSWSSVGIVPKVDYVSAHVFHEWIRDGTAHQFDRYIASCDIINSEAGALLQAQFDKLSACTGLRITPNFGPQVNAWWGAAGHREALHCDITDGTLWQLAGIKRVALFPPAQWENLYPFPPEEGGKTSWAFCRASGVEPDVEKFPKLKEAMHHKAEAILHPGDILYIPAGWAHEVSGHEGHEDHVLSVNRFWHTPMAKTWFLPKEVKLFLSGQIQKVQQLNNASEK